MGGACAGRRRVLRPQHITRCAGQCSSAAGPTPIVLPEKLAPSTPRMQTDPGALGGRQDQAGARNFVKRDEYLADEHVAGFTQWAAQLVTGELGVKHQWKSRGTDFRCSTLHEALDRYWWPDNGNGLDHRAAAQQLREFRNAFRDIGVVDNRVKQDRFVDNACAVVKWAGTPLPKKLNEWRDMPPDRLQVLVQGIREKLDPRTADTDDLYGFRYMGSGFSKIYSVLIDGFPIYDSRVACALACLVRIYCGHRNIGHKPDALWLRIPPRRKPKSPRYHRCDHSRMNGNCAAYAEVNLKAAWLLQEMVRVPGKFGHVEGFAPVDALQHALFMIGYARLPDGALSAT